MHWQNNTTANTYFTFYLPRYKVCNSRTIWFDNLFIENVFCHLSIHRWPKWNSFEIQATQLKFTQNNMIERCIIIYPYSLSIGICDWSAWYAPDGQSTTHSGILDAYNGNRAIPINKIKIRSGTYVDAVRFSWAAGCVSQWYGCEGGSEGSYTVNTAKGEWLITIYGRAGLTIESLQFKAFWGNISPQHDQNGKCSFIISQPNTYQSMTAVEL